MHIVWIVLKVIAGLIALAVVLAVLFAWWVTEDGSNPFQ